jgi:hypothetical protein
MLKQRFIETRVEGNPPFVSMNSVSNKTCRSFSIRFFGKTISLSNFISPKFQPVNFGEAEISDAELGFDCKLRETSIWSLQNGTLRLKGHRKMTKFALKNCVAAVIALGFAAPLAAEQAGEFSPEIRAQIDALLAEVPSMDLDAMEPLNIAKFTLPEPGIDLMRVKIEETYTIDGVGEETVQLTGYMAVVHGEPVAIDPDKPLAWNNAMTGTEFVALELTGESELFGTVEVSLDTNRTSIGRVGSFAEAPMDFLIEAGVSADDVDQIAPPTGQCEKLADGSFSPNCAASCYAPLSVSVEMEDLDLQMSTGAPVLMYSYVDTIPPVGQTASISATGRTLIHDGRAVGTLDSAAVKFREVILSQPLDGGLLDERFNMVVSLN